MKLQDLEVIIVGNPPPSYGGRYFIFTKLTTDNGIVGYGEVYAATVGPQAMKAVIEDLFGRYFQGCEPHRIEHLYRMCYSSGFTQRPDLTVMGAFSGLEIACWDILGKSVDKPVHQLIGGELNRQLRAYTYLYCAPGTDEMAFYADPIASAERAVHYADLGFTAVKFDPAGSYHTHGGYQPALAETSRCVDFCREIRAAVGDRVDMLFGTHGQFTTGGAIRVAAAIEQYAPLWFEEPVPPDNLSAFAEVAKHTSIPIATGERFCGKTEFAAALSAGGVSVVQPALGRAGGIWEGRKIALLAEMHNAQIAPHLYAGPIEWAANIQLGATCPNLLMLESIEQADGFYGELIHHGIQWDGGFIELPTEPGLGVTLNEALARANPYSGDALHLQMTDQTRRYGAQAGVAKG